MNFPFNNKTAVELFSDFWYEKPDKHKISNDSRTLANFKKRICTVASTEEIDSLIMESNTNKETLRYLAISFYDYLTDKYNAVISSELYNIKYYDYPFERQLEIAKYLHQKHSTVEIAEHFNVDERTIRKDIEALRDGIEVLGNRIQIKEEKEGRNKYYKSTLHPVFLPLNLTEVYALTVYLPQVVKGSYNAEIINSISNRIKHQLSEYAQSKLFPEVKCYKKGNYLTYINDEDLAKSKKGILMYLIKSGQKATFYYNNNKSYGYVRYNTKTNRYAVFSENGEPLDINIDEADFIIEELEYK